MTTSWRMTPVGITRVFFTSILLILIVNNAISSPTSPGGSWHDYDKEGRELPQVNKVSTPVSQNNDKEHETAHPEIDPVGNTSAELPDDLSSILNGNSISPETQVHLLSKRQVRNDYERFYLCLFTLFTNPECRQRAEFNDNNRNSDLINNPYDMYNLDGGSSNNYQFMPLVPNNQPQRPLSFLGLGLNGLGQIGQGLGLNRFQNNFPQQQLPQQQQPQFNGNFVRVTPYPEPQVNRRPGPESLLRGHTYYPFLTTIKTTTTTARPTTAPTTTQRYEPTTLKIVQAFTTVTPTSTPKAETNFEEFTSVSVSPQELTSSSEVGSTSSGTPDPDCDTPSNKQTQSLPSQTSTAPVVIENWPTVSLGQTPSIAGRPISSIQEEEDEDVSVLFEKRFQMYGKLEEENRVLKSQANVIELQLQSYQVQTKYLQEALSTVQEETTTYKRRVSQLERTNNDLQQQNGQLQHSAGDQKSEMNELKAKVKYLEETLVRLSKQNLPLTREIQRHQRQVRELEEKLRKLTEANRECRSQIYNVQTQKFRLDSDEMNSDDVIGQGLVDDNPMGSLNLTSQEEESVTSQSVEVTTELDPEIEGSTSVYIPSSTMTTMSTLQSISSTLPSISTSTMPPMTTSKSGNISTSTLASISTSTPITSKSTASPTVKVVAEAQVLPKFVPNLRGAVNEDTEGLSQNSPFSWNLPLFPRIFDQRYNLGYGQNQNNYRNL